MFYQCFLSIFELLNDLISRFSFLIECLVCYKSFPDLLQLQAELLMALSLDMDVLGEQALFKIFHYQFFFFFISFAFLHAILAEFYVVYQCLLNFLG